MRFSSKAEIISETEKQWEALWLLADQCGQGQKTQRQLKQILAHLYAWHRLFLTWYASGPDGQPALPAPGFNWRQTPDLNRKLDLEMESIGMESIRRRLKRSHGRVMKTVHGLTEKQLMEPGHFDWTGKNPIASYIVPNTASHYRWAIKKIKKLPLRTTKP